MSEPNLVQELFEFLRTEKKYWLVPLVLFVAVLVVLIAFSQASAVAPFVYTLF
jgi:hypothetical protein